MKPNYRSQVREDIARELDRLSRLRRQQRELMKQADRVNAETRRLMEALQQSKPNHTLH